MDVFAELAELGLASRLRRLSEALSRDATALYDDLGVAFQPRWFPVFYLLCRSSAGSVGTLARDLGLTHAAVSQVAAQMARSGLVRQKRDRHDDRRRLVLLTAKGRQLRMRLEPVWKEIRASAAEVLSESGVDLLNDVGRVERVLANRSVMDRVRRRLSLPARGVFTIEEYRPAYKKHFRALNEAWLSDRFAVEPQDARLLRDPNGRVIRRGGRILFGLVDGTVVGTCALVRHADGSIELCKMTVAPEFRRRGFGTALAAAGIGRARSMGATRLYLRSAPELEEALRIYRRLGFKKARHAPTLGAPYARSGFTMVLDLNRSTGRPSREVSS